MKILIIIIKKYQFLIILRNCLITKYCILDCTILHEIIINFNKLVYDRFGINIENYPTISSLSFAIYRTHY